jgi:hypothetical protein
LWGKLYVLVSEYVMSWLLTADCIYVFHVVSPSRCMDTLIRVWNKSQYRWTVSKLQEKKWFCWFHGYWLVRMWNKSVYKQA